MAIAIKRLATGEADFAARLKELLAFEAAADENIERTVAGILADVKARGDAAVVEYTNRFDRLSAKAMADLELGQAELQQARAAMRATLTRLLDQDRDYAAAGLKVREWMFVEKLAEELAQAQPAA